MQTSWANKTEQTPAQAGREAGHICPRGRQNLVAEETGPGSMQNFTRRGWLAPQPHGAGAGAVLRATSGDK